MILRIPPAALINRNMSATILILIQKYPKIKHSFLSNKMTKSELGNIRHNLDYIEQIPMVWEIKASGREAMSPVASTPDHSQKAAPFDFNLFAAVNFGLSLAQAEIAISCKTVLATPTIGGSFDFRGILGQGPRPERFSTGISGSRAREQNKFAYSGNGQRASSGSSRKYGRRCAGF